MDDQEAIRICRKLLLALNDRRAGITPEFSDTAVGFHTIISVPSGTTVTEELIANAADKLHELAKRHKLSAFAFRRVPEERCSVETYNGVSMRVIISHDVLHDLQIIRADIHG